MLTFFSLKKVNIFCIAISLAVLGAWSRKEAKIVFPKSCSGNKIIDAIGDITTSPSTKWHEQTGVDGAYIAKGDIAK